MKNRKFDFYIIKRYKNKNLTNVEKWGIKKHPLLERWQSGNAADC